MYREFNPTKTSDNELDSIQYEVKEVVQEMRDEFYFRRVHKPNLEYEAAKSIKITASVAKPFYVLIGGRIFKVETTIRCDFNLTGPGGMATGVSFAASTPYYIYLIETRGVVSMLADTLDPSVGPQNVKDWSYVGCVLTNATPALYKFMYSDGVCILGDVAPSTTQVQSATLTARTLSPWPATVREHYLGLFHAATTTNQNGRVAGDSTTTGFPLRSRSQVANIALYCFVYGWVPALSGTTIYVSTEAGANGSSIVEPVGWREDLGEWK